MREVLVGDSAADAIKRHKPYIDHVYRVQYVPERTGQTYVDPATAERKPLTGDNPLYLSEAFMQDRWFLGTPAKMIEWLPRFSLSDDAVIEKASVIINRAVENGLTSVQVFRFPHAICTDNGRAINQAEAGWEQTLTDIPKEIYEFWKRQLQPQGYHIRYEVIDYPGGMPGDIGTFLSWA